MPGPPHPEHLPAEQLLRWAASTFGHTLAITTSFQDEGMVIVDMIAKIDSSIRVITVDTGRLPEETFSMIDRVRARYGIAVETVLPEAGEVEEMTRRHGANLFYDDPSLRLLCCQIRKVRPLERKLKEFNAWVVGLRRGQSKSRAALRKIEESEGRLKISPLADWSRDRVRAYIEANGVPRHPLYARGYTSIGCAPCTRANESGADERAGRWWWETGQPKECGIHYTAEGRLRRRVDVLLDEILEPRPLTPMVAPALAETAVAGD
jgi:phosphoadenosine phosphosulfate reductase